MKRMLALLLAALMILSLVSCASSLVSPKESKTEEKKPVNNKKEEEEIEEDEISYPEGFTVGYGRVNITPSVALPIYDATAEEMNDPLMLTCTAVCDGENVALLMSADLKGIQRSVATSAASAIERALGIPKDNILISATHTHSAHTAGGSSDAMVGWLKVFYKKVVECAEEALLDLAPAEAYAGASHTDGITFVRRYLLADGTYKTNPSAADQPRAHESVADNELRTIRFAREGKKKDIVMMNYQTHYCLYVEKYSADFVGHLRKMCESEMDAHFVYYSGASGNLNFSGKLSGEVKYPDREEAVKHMWEVAKEAMKGEKKLSTGKVISKASLYDAKVLKDSAERVRQAKEINALDEKDPKRDELMVKYGFGSKRWVQGVITRSGLDATQAIPFHAVSFGDIAFTSSPIEQFDANAKQARDASPFEMTFTLSLTNGSYGYVPTTEAFPHGGYEVAVCRYVQGSGEEFAQEQLRLLNLCKTQSGQ